MNANEYLSDGNKYFHIYLGDRVAPYVVQATTAEALRAKWEKHGWTKIQRIEEVEFIPETGEYKPVEPQP